MCMLGKWATVQPSGPGICRLCAFLPPGGSSRGTLGKPRVTRDLDYRQITKGGRKTWPVVMVTSPAAAIFFLVQVNNCDGRLDSIMVAKQETL